MINYGKKGSFTKGKSSIIPATCIFSKEGMKESKEQSPNKILEIKHVIEEGTIIAVHSHARPFPSDGYI